jgi:hypothetical protein
MDPFDVVLTLDQNPYLSVRHTEMHAVLEITAGSPAGGTGATLAEVLIIDCSGSMSTPKLTAAKHATRVAVDALPDGALFAMVRGDHEACMVYPKDRTLAIASEPTRAEAKDAIDREAASGGTVLAECTGRFVCDPRGIGDRWKTAALVRIAAELRGTPDAVAPPQDLADDFRRTIEAAAAKMLPDLRLRIATSTFDRLLYCRQVYPSIAEIAGEQAPSAGDPVEVSLGIWGAETRRYHLCFEVAPDGRPAEEDQRVARIDVVADRPLATAPALVLVHWTADPARSGRIDPSVAHVTGQEELREATNAGCEAYERGDRTGAERHWGEAVRLATAAGDTGKLADLSMFVRVVDGPAGRVELRRDLSVLDVKRGALRSLLTEAPVPSDARPPVQEKGAEAAPPPEKPCPTEPGPGGPARTCAVCGRVADAEHGFCQSCGRNLDGPA